MLLGLFTSVFDTLFYPPFSEFPRETSSFNDTTSARATSKNLSYSISFALNSSDAATSLSTCANCFPTIFRAAYSLLTISCNFNSSSNNDVFLAMPSRPNLRAPKLSVGTVSFNSCSSPRKNSHCYCSSGLPALTV